MGRVSHTGFARAEFAVLLITLILVAYFAGSFWFETLTQPLVDQHGFRQTQTALSTYYLFADGTHLLNYQTPVVGYPWAIPFEFPSYQFAVFLLHKVTGIGLDVAGRATSIAFGVGSLLAAMFLLRLLNFSRNTCLVFAILFLASPIYLYWNRTFMIESMALFLTLSALCCYIKSRTSKRISDSASGIVLDPFLWGLMFFLTLALITKVTTSFTIFIVIGLDLTLLLAQRFVWSTPVTEKSLHWLFAVAAILVSSFAVLLMWTSHADALKAANPIGIELTSGNLKNWNFGRLKDLFSYELWGHVVYGRMLTPAGFGPAIVLLLSSLWIARRQFKIVFAVFAFLGLAIVPLLVFSNLHQVHNYYQSANQIFLLAAIAIAATAITSNNPLYHFLRISCLAGILYGGYEHFNVEYYASSQKTGSQEFHVANTVKSITKPGEGIIVFGYNWSSAIAYHSERRALTVPKFVQRRRILTRAQIFSGRNDYLGGLPLGAIVFPKSLNAQTRQRACRSDKPIPERKMAGAFIYDCMP